MLPPRVCMRALPHNHLSRRTWSALVACWTALTLLPQLLTNVDEVDHDMHKRLMRAVEGCYIEVIDLWEECDGLQDNTFVKSKASKVLIELISDERMAGHQHLASSSAQMLRGTGYWAVMPMDQ